MREESIKSSDIRILVGGKFENYLGKMPGVLEEFLIAYKQDLVIFLVGGLGGLTKKLCISIKNRKIEEEFTEEWQMNHNDAYQDLQEIASQHGKHTDYDNLKEVIENITIPILAERTGLTNEEYERLMTTPFIDESIYLILKSIKNLPK